MDPMVRTRSSPSTISGLAALLLAVLFPALASPACSDAAGVGPGSGFEALGDVVDAAGRPRRIQHVASGMVLRLVDAGTCAMGTPATEAKRDGDEFQYQATLDAPYYLGETEVTVGQWMAVMGEPPRNDHAAEPATDTTLPATGVSWHEAARFIETLNDDHGSGWSLPTEVQWEYACRAGTTTPFSFGETITPEQVNYHGRYPYGDAERGLERGAPLPVGSLPANAWGFHDMHGNVWEWCEDIYFWDPTDIPPWTQDEGASRCIRGGAWTSSAKECRSGFREGYAPSSDGEKYGLRVAKAAGG
jgi:formylglycine-generating enzyme required for sulfatase activity